MAPSQPLIAAESGQPTLRLSDIGPAKYDESHPTHRSIVQMALDTIIRLVINSNPLLSEEAQKQQVHSALSTAASSLVDAGESTSFQND